MENLLKLFLLTIVHNNCLTKKTNENQVDDTFAVKYLSNYGYLWQKVDETESDR